MTAYTSTRAGIPTSGRFLVNDTVTDVNGTVWRCVVGGMASGDPSAPGYANFAPQPNVGVQGTPAAKTTTTTLTAAELLAGIITANQGAAGAAVYTLPLATAMDTALPNSQPNDFVDFFLTNISTAAAETVSIATNTGWTLVGDMGVASNNATANESTGHFRARKTATGAWTLYRLAS